MCLSHKRLKRFRLFPVLNCDGGVGVFPAHRRGRAAQQPGHRACRSMDRNASRYLLAFRERQRQSRATPRNWTNSSVWRHLEINGR